MKNKNLSLKLEFDFVKEKLSFMKNTSFHEAVVRIMSDGENNNGTYFTKEAIEKALWSIKNIPLVGLFKEDENNFGGHEPVYEVRDGKMDVMFNTTPFGVIHESAKQWFEVVEENGVKKEYLVSECLFWKRQKGYDLLKEKGKFAVSMEIEVLDGEFNDSIEFYEIKDFMFTAIAILGKGVEPCFQSANVQLFSKNSEYECMMAEAKQFSKQLYELMKEGEDMQNDKQFATPTMDDLLQAGVQAEQVDMVMDLIEEITKAQALGIDVTKYFAEKPTMDKLLEVGLKQEQAEQILDLIEEVSKAKALGVDVKSIMKTVQEKQTSAKRGGSKDEEEKKRFADNEQETEEDSNSDEEQSTEEDKKDEDEEKQFADEEQSTEVDPTEVNEEEDIKSLLEKAVSATTSDEILDIFDQMLTVAGLGEVDIRSLFAKESDVDLKEQLLSVTTEFENMKSEYERLVAFEQSVLEEQKKEAIDSLFAKFSALDGFDGFDELKDKAMDMPVDEVEQQLFALLGKKSFSLNTPVVDKKEPMTVVFERTEQPTIHGTGVLDKYLTRK